MTPSRSPATYKPSNKPTIVMPLEDAAGSLDILSGVREYDTVLREFMS